MILTEGGQTREVNLAGANLGRPSVPGGPLVYNGWHWNDKGSYFSHLDMGVEFLTHVSVKEGKSHLEVSLVVDHQEKQGLTCQALATGIAITLEPISTDSIHRFAALINEGGSFRQSNGSLELIGALQVESAVRRAFASGELDRKRRRDDFVRLVAPGLKKINPASIRQIEARLSGPVKIFWDETLKQAGYAYYPEMKRYAAWVIEGARPIPWHDTDSIQAGFMRFVDSPVWPDKGIRDLFAEEVGPALKGVPEQEAQRLQDQMGETAGNFFKQLWNKSTGKRTLADYPDVQQMIEGIDAIVNADPKSFDAERAQNAVMAFFRSPRSKEADAVKAFLAAAHPLVRRLSLRQQEDILVWLPGSEKKTFRELAGRSMAGERPSR